MWSIRTVASTFSSVLVCILQNEIMCQAQNDIGKFLPRHCFHLDTGFCQIQWKKRTAIWHLCNRPPTWYLLLQLYTDFCSYKLPVDIIWLDSKCVFWFVQYVVLLTYCNVSSDIYIYLFSTMVFHLYFVVLHKLVGAETKWPLRPSLRVPAFLIKYSMLGRDTEINWTGAEFRLFCSCRSSLTFSVKLGHRRTADARNVFVIMTPVN